MLLKTFLLFFKVILIVHSTGCRKIWKCVYIHKLVELLCTLQHYILKRYRINKNIIIIIIRFNFRIIFDYKILECILIYNHVLMMHKGLIIHVRKYSTMVVWFKHLTLSVSFSICNVDYKLASTQQSEVDSFITMFRLEWGMVKYLNSLFTILHKTHPHSTSDKYVTVRRAFRSSILTSSRRSVQVKER